VTSEAILDDTVRPTSADNDNDTPAAGLGRATRWERVGLVVLLVGTAVAYLWDITVNRMGNGFYAASAWAGSRDWQALLFGSLDPGNFITVDKPPVSQWVMGLSGQVFGFSSASMLVPEAIMGVLAVWLLYGAVTRAVASRGAGLLAGAALAVTPVAAMMFRFNNPDAAMVLLMTAGAYCTIRALPRASWRWLVLAGVALGFAFLAKMLEGLMVLPALAVAYLVVAPTTVGRRVAHLLAAAAALVITSGWYVLLTIAWPAHSRPYLAGSTDNTFMNLVLGYNGFSRFLGHNHHGANPFELPEGYELPFHWPGSQASATRLFSDEVGFEISWLLPAALLAFVLLIVARGRRPRTDLVRGAALVFGLWMLIDGASLSAMKGGMAPYYSFAIAPAIAGVLAVAVGELWRCRETGFGRLGFAALVLASGGWGFVLLQRNGDWQPWLRWVVLAVTVAAALGVALAATPVLRQQDWAGRVAAVLSVLGMIAGLGGSTAYAVATLPVPHTGGRPSVGPAQPDNGKLAGAMMLFWGSQQPNDRLDAMLAAAHTPWSAAVERSAIAAKLELDSRTSVMAVGGFTDEDPAPTLAQFQKYVRTHQVRYYIAQKLTLPDDWRTGDAVNPEAGVRRPGPGGWWPGDHRDIADWVATHYKAIDVGNATVYDLMQRVS
jgi:4-amino-4-deoxy-L-arabinose transferase-like glycosyltransferase